MKKIISKALLVLVLGVTSFTVIGCGEAGEASYSLNDVNPQLEKEKDINVAVADKSASLADVYVAMVKDQPYELNIARNTLEKNGMDTSDMTDYEVDEFVMNEIASVLTSARLSQSPQRGATLDYVSKYLGTLIIDAADTSVGQYVMSTAFDLVLDDLELTKTMIRLAIASQTITDLMVDTMKDDWDLTKKMEPFLAVDAEFGELFTLLSQERPKVGVMSFEKITPSLYYALTQSMALSKKTTLRMSQMLNSYALVYLVLPGQGSKGIYGQTDTFSKLFFDENNTEANHRFFYTVFSQSEATNYFIKGFKKVKNNDETVSTAFLDLIILGKNLNGVENIPLSYLNIRKLVAAMYYGAENEGYETYASGLIGFALLIQEERYLPYGQRFFDVGIGYADEKGYNADIFKEMMSNYAFSGIDLESIGIKF